jgi:hypothetical protein
MQEQIWLSVKDCAALMNISPRAIRQSIDKYVHKTAKGKGGAGYMIELSSLPLEAQRSYIKQVAAVATPSTAAILPAISEADRNMKAYNAATASQRAFADKWLLILRDTESMTRKSIDAYVSVRKIQEPELTLSRSRIYDMRKRHAAHGLAGLLPNWGKSKGKSSTPDYAYEIFKSAYLKEGAPSVRSCWMQALGAHKIAHPEAQDFPSEKAFERRLVAEIPEESRYLARYGYSLWKRKYQMYVNRNYDDINAGEIWTSDHAQIDVACRLPDGSVCFPWVTVWRDFKTGLWLGWMLEVGAGNSDRIFQTFYYAATAYGLPEAVILDNGKDYRSKDFAGGRKIRHETIKIAVDEKKTDAMLSKLNIYAHFANPYGSQTKPIERDFRTIKEYLSKNMPGYRGGNVVERPEVLKSEIKNDTIVAFADFKALFEVFVEKVLLIMPNGGKLKGQSRLAAFNEGYIEKRNISNDALALFCMRVSKSVSIGRNGVHDSKLQQDYWGEWMDSMKGRKVYMRRDPKNYDNAYVFDAADDSFLGKARMAVMDAPAFAQSTVTKEQVSTALHEKKRAEKVVKSYLKRTPATAEQVIERLTKAAEHLNKAPIVEANPIVRITATEMDSVLEEANKTLPDINYGQLIPLETRKQKIKTFETEDEYECDNDYDSERKIG